MDPKLYECALNGDVVQLKALILGDEHLLERSEAANSKGNNILHIAAIYGHVQFARDVLNAKPELSSELNEAGLSPLHLAAGKGHLDLVKLLLAVDPDLSYLKDKHGRNSAHTAAMKGRLDVLKEIVSVNPWCLKETTDKGETVMHLSAKENRIEVVQYLVGREEIKDIINEGDCSGNTALHLAAARNQKEVIRILANGSTVNVNALNKYNITPRELWNRRSGSLQSAPDANDEILVLLSPADAPASVGPTVSNGAPASTEIAEREKSERAQNARSKLADNTMIVAILIATVTFQAAVTPPGGFWQDSKSAGTAVLAAAKYDRFMLWDTLAFHFSLDLILWLVIYKSTVFPEPFARGWILAFVILALLFLTAALFNAIEVTKPLGSNASNNIIWVGIGSISGSLLLLLGFMMYYRMKERLQRA